MAITLGPIQNLHFAIIRRLVGLTAAVLLLAGLPEPAWSAAPPASSQRPLRPEIESFIDEMASKHAFDRQSLRRMFREAQPRPAIIRAISTPGTARPWHEFRRLYIEEKRIAGGIDFWRQHTATLARARREFGVPEEIIVATIGAETYYGRNIGRFKVLEALSMLAFDYPPRAPLFRTELEEFLLLTRETGFDARGTRGSYAGAMGIPQFLPSSYRKYAVDFDGDGRPDLWASPVDAIGSVANYYRSFGWQNGAAIAVEAQVAGEEAEAMIAAGIKPHASIAEMRRRGIAPLMPVDDEALAALVRIEAESGPQHWLGLQNFYVITRYNRSVNYAMVVYELARELRARLRDTPLDPSPQ
jgi:membrane-bound lytic murein transglycosylase B